MDGDHLAIIIFVRADADEGRKEMLYLTTHAVHFMYGIMASDIW